MKNNNYKYTLYKLRLLILKILFFLNIFLFNNYTNADENIIFFNQQVGEKDKDKIGGKAYNLFQLQQIQNINVPKWFCLKIDNFQNFLKYNNILPLIEEFNKNFEEGRNLDSLYILSEKIHQKILDSKIDQKTYQEIEYAIAKLKKLINKNNIKYVVRSSGVNEDVNSSSLAGIYDSFLNLKDSQDIVESVKKVWASSFSKRAVTELQRLSKNRKTKISNDIAVIIQEMIVPEVSGVVTSRDVSTNYPAIQISANYGFGETVVEGEIDCDQWLIHKDGGYIIKKILGKKSKLANLNKKGLKLQNTHKDSSKKFSIEDQEIKKLAASVKQIEAYFKHDIDSEFAITDNRKIYFVQTRALINRNLDNTYVIDADLGIKTIPIAKALYSIPTVRHGKILVVRDWKDLATNKDLDQNTILVAYRIANAWSHYISRIAGIVTKEGSPTSHVTLLARERNIASISGIGDDFEELIKYEGKEVTLDGINKKIYPGYLKLKPATKEDLINSFKVVEIKPLPSFESQLKHLKESNMILLDGNKYCIKTPSYKIKKLEQEINLKRFDVIYDLISIKNLNLTAKVIDNFVCNHLQPFQDLVNAFSNIDLESAELFIKSEKDNMQKYLKSTKKFTLTDKSWKEYVDSFTKLRTYIWIGGGLRAHLNKLVEQEAARIKLPQYFLDEAYSSIQSNIFEEDSEMQNKINELAAEFAKLPQKYTLNEVKLSRPELYNKVIKLAKSYRFTHNISLDMKFDPEIVYQKILSHLKDGKVEKIMSSKGLNKEFYFPDNKKLLKLIELSLQNRVNQSNAHHYHIRGQWFVQEKLLNLATKLVKKGKISSVNEIYDCSVLQISEYINEL